MAARTGTAQEDLRRANVSALLWRVHTLGPTNRARLTEELGLNRSTIGDLTSQLESLGLVTEEAPTAEPDTARGRRSGRPSLVVAPRHDVAVVAAALEVDRITVALVALGGEVLDRRFRRHLPGEHDVRNVVHAVAAQCRELLDDAPGVRCLGVGVSVPGMVRAADGMVRFAPNLGWVDEPFTALLSEALGLQVSTGNDASLGVTAEHLRGSAVGVDEVAFVNGSVGIGGGFLVGGRPLQGYDGYAGEIGHVIVDATGPECRCGLTGCWETRVGEANLLVGAGRLPGGGPEAVAEVVSAAAQGDTRAAESLDNVAHWTGAGLRNVVHVFNPEIIVLGGVLAHVWESRPAKVLDGLDRGAKLPLRDVVRIRPAALGVDSALLGAAELAFAPLVADPLGWAAAEHGAAGDDAAPDDRAQPTPRTLRGSGARSVSEVAVR